MKHQKNVTIKSKTKEKGTMKLNYKKTIYVGLAFLLISMFWQAYDAIIPKILIDKFGLNQTASGAVMALDNVLALFLLPFFGYLSDKTNHKKGRRTPYVIIGTILAAFLFVGMSFVDNYQTKKIETETNIIEKYELVKNIDEDATKAEWGIIVLTMDESSYKTSMANLLEDYSLLDKLSKDDYNTIKDHYYNYLASHAWEETKASPAVFIIFIVMLFFTLVMMSTFRSPAVALMPDVTIKPLRSKANAVINLMGAVGAITSIILLMILGVDKYSYVNYIWAFVIVGFIMLMMLAIFLYKVDEKKLVEEKIKLEAELKIVDEEENQSHDQMSKAKFVSLLLILFSVFFWFMGYNAVTTKLSDYAPKVLNMGYATPLLIAQATAIVGFIPIGIISSKIGRKKMILFGVVLLAVCFFSASILTAKTGILLYVVLGLTGIAWASINVNSYPMVVELSRGSDVGKYTGYYYTFSMAAQIVTPLLSGLFMDNFGRTILFPYATVFVIVSFVTMFFVKHGDVKPEVKSIIESFDVDMD